MPRQGLDRARVVDAAAAIADADGLEAVTLARVAAALEVRAPSLYNHVAGRDDLLAGVAVRGLQEVGAAMREAATGRAGEAALIAAAQAFRDYARAHPGRYGATVRASDDPEIAAAAAAVFDVLHGVLRAWDLDDAGEIHALRALRSAVHGFVLLEAAGGFGLPVDVDASFARLVAIIAGGLGATPTGR
jgi:AcrR family transcriptional regulator